MSFKINGIAASDGIGVAEAYLLVAPDLTFQKYKVKNGSAEKERLHQALQAAIKDIKKIKVNATDRLGNDELAVFDAHIAILSDPEMLRVMESEIEDHHINAEDALVHVTDKFAQILADMTDNPYMQERGADVKDVAKRVLSHLLGKTLPNLSMIDHPVVVVAHELKPSDTSQMDKRFVKGIITDVGGRTSHAAIMARTMRIPAIVCSGKATTQIHNGDRLIIDGLNGICTVNPNEKEVSGANTSADRYLKQRIEWDKLVSEPSVSKDGKKFEIAANIGTVNDIKDVKKFGGDAVGLFRTEFLYMQREELPTEEQQFVAYRKSLEMMNGKPVVIRTMDIGGDKPLKYLPLPEEMNPFLGYRAIRISLDKKEIFKAQLRALIRASKYGQLRIMFPMIATLDEFRNAKALFEEQRKDLQKSQPGIGADIKLGIMIEVPIAAIFADQFAKEVDFFSIGTNDLIQYSFAADRGNDAVSYLYQQYNPALLRLIRHVVVSAHKEGKIAAMCGEMAGDELALPLLMGIGLDEYSMSATSILRSRSLMKSVDTRDCANLVDEVIDHCQTNDEARKLVHDTLAKRGYFLANHDAPNLN